MATGTISGISPDVTDNPISLAGIIISGPLFGYLSKNGLFVTNIYIPISPDSELLTSSLLDHISSYTYTNLYNYSGKARSSLGPSSNGKTVKFTSCIKIVGNVYRAALQTGYNFSGSIGLCYMHGFSATMT